MWRLLRFLITGDGHLHKWAVIHKGTRINECGQTTGYHVTQKCEHCGKIIHKNL